MEKIIIPEGASRIIRELNNRGFEGFVVGGCVRDSLLGKTPNDWDITTSATPEEVKAIFPKTFDTGIEHGTVTVVFKNEHGYDNYEVTTYRIDGKYSDHRRPESVEFTRSLEEDLKRRDFTINAMAYSEDRGVVDLFGGMEDLKSGIIKCVGEASERFDEDALRILRAIRFAAQLGFEIEEKTREAMKNQARFLSDISAERIQVELSKLLVSDNPGRLEEAYELGITKIILPEFDKTMVTTQENPYHCYDVGHHILKVVENIAPEKHMRYAALLHDIAKPDVKTIDEKGVAHFYGHQDASEKMGRKILRRLTLDNHTIDEACKMIKYHDMFLDGNVGKNAFRRFVSTIGADSVREFFAIRKADLAGQSDYKIEEKNEAVARLEKMFEEILADADCLSMKDLKLNGKDLIDMGMSQGPGLGRILKTLFDKVLDEPALNDEETLRALAMEMMTE